MRMRKRALRTDCATLYYMLGCVRTSLRSVRRSGTEDVIDENDVVMDAIEEVRWEGTPKGEMCGSAYVS